MATYQFTDPKTGKHYNVRNIKGVRTRVYADGKKVATPQTAAQKQRIADNAPDSATRPQTIADINKASGQAADLKYGEAQRGLGSDISTSPTQQGRITDWFSQYQATLDDINKNTNAQYDAAVTNATTLKTNTANAADADTKTRMDAAAADAANRGTTVDPSIQGQADAAKASRGSAVDAIAAVIGGQKANAINFQGKQKAGVGGQELVEHNRETSHLNDLKTKLRDLLTEKGDYEATTRQDLISGERKNLLENATLNSQIVNNALDNQAANNRTTTTATTADQNRNAANTRAADQRAATAKGKYGPGTAIQNKYGYTYDEWTKLGPKAKDKARAGKSKPGAKDNPKTGVGSLTPAAETSLVGKVNSYVSQFKNPPLTWVDQADHSKGQRKMSKDEVYRELLRAGADQRVVYVADSIFRNKGSIGPNGVKNAHNLGIRVNGRWKVLGTTPKSTTNYSGGAGAGSGIS